MNHELLSDIWNVLSDKIPEKNKADVAQEYITTLLDYGVSETVLENMMGIDTHLDTAIEYAIEEEGDYEEDWEDE